MVGSFSYRHQVCSMCVDGGAGMVKEGQEQTMCTATSCATDTDWARLFIMVGLAIHTTWYPWFS